MQPSTSPPSQSQPFGSAGWTHTPRTTNSLSFSSLSLSSTNSRPTRRTSLVYKKVFTKLKLVRSILGWMSLDHQNRVKGYSQLWESVVDSSKESHEARKKMKRSGLGKPRSINKSSVPVKGWQQLQNDGPINSYINTSTNPRLNIAFVHPIVKNILHHLSGFDIRRAQRVCMLWNDLLKEEEFDGQLFRFGRHRVLDIHPLGSYPRLHPVLTLPFSELEKLLGDVQLLPDHVLQESATWPPTEELRVGFGTGEFVKVKATNVTPGEREFQSLNVQEVIRYTVRILRHDWWMKEWRATRESRWTLFGRSLVLKIENSFGGFGRDGSGA